MSTSPSPSRRQEDVNMKESVSIPPSRVLGIFGMSIFTRRDDLEKIFGEYGTVEKVELIYNRQTGRSKGFGFVYFERQEDAEIARLKTNGLELNERSIRVDFSRTESAHDATPGFYNGKPIEEIRRDQPRRSFDRFDDRREQRGRGDRFGGRDSDRHYAPRRRSQSRETDRERGGYRADRIERSDRVERVDREYRGDRMERNPRDYRDSRDYRDTRDYRRRSPSPRN